MGIQWSHVDTASELRFRFCPSRVHTVYPERLNGLWLHTRSAYMASASVSNRMRSAEECTDEINSHANGQHRKQLPTTLDTVTGCFVQRV
jgi:hypothetical protein